MNDQGPQLESEFVFRRLTETFKVFSKELDGHWWLLALGVVLAIGIFFVIWMYIKDSRAVRWFWATPLAVLRITVYLCLALLFLMPARQGYERVEKRSRVLIVLDVSDSMSQLSDDPASSQVSSKPRTRLSKVLDYLSDEKVGFVKSLLEKNPVYVYRVGNRLDEEAQQLEKSENGAMPVHRVPGPDGGMMRATGKAWSTPDWQAFGAYDFKPWLLRGLSEDGVTKVKSTRDWDGNNAGNFEWAQKWFDAKDAIPTDLADSDRVIINSNREKLLARIEVARTIGGATNIPDSLLSLVNREAGNMVQGVVVFSDGQSNLGNSNAVRELGIRSKREKIPVFTIGVGSEQKVIAVRITDLQAPDQTPPDEPFKIIVEQDGDGLVGQKAKVELEVQLPKGEGAAPRIAAELTYAPGEPPHGQAEILINPENVPDALKDKDNPKQLVEGEWKVRAVTPRVDGERFQEKEHFSEWVTIKVQKRPARVLVACSAPNRDFQFLITQLMRDKADLSVFVQNKGGQDGRINLLEDPERQLVRFPDTLRVDELPNEDPKEKWYNLARYDVIITFDMDWNQLTAEQTALLRTWVDLQAGGLLFVAGQIFTEYLARPSDEDKFKPIIDILPVLPGDPKLAAAKRTATIPWRLEFDNLGGDLDFMKLDDEIPRVETAWELFFTGREERDDKARMLRGFFNYFPIREMKPVATPIARFPDPNAIKMPDGKSPPWLVTMQYGQGRTAWVGSPEIWRLRQYRDAYFERFWTKFIRYMAAGSRRKQTRRGRMLASPVVGQGGYFRPNVQLLDTSLKPVEQKTEPKMTIRPVELDRYPAEIEKLTGDEAIARAKAAFHAKFTYEMRLASKKTSGGESWEGWFQRSVSVSAEKFPTGTWRADVEIPSSTDTLRHRFQVKQSNPELDVTRPDFKALYEIASLTSDLSVKDPSVVARLQTYSTTGAEGKRLAFKFGDEEALKVIPDCMDSSTKESRNRGAVEDYWDKGIELPSFMTSWYSDKPMRVGLMLLVIVGLLSIEWLTRKLLKLA